MSNYPNMSYCMFENTASAMMQIIEAMKEEDVGLYEDLSRSENRYFNELYALCEEFIYLADDITERTESVVHALDEEEQV